MLGLHCCMWAFSSRSELGLLFVAVCGLLTAVASLVAEHGLQVCRLQQLWLVGSRAQAQQLWRTGLVAPWNVGSSWTRDRTLVPCIGRRILNNCTTREVPKVDIFLKKIFICLHQVLFIYLFLYLFLAVLGLPFCARAFSSCGKRGPLIIAVCGPLHYRGLSCCRAQAPDAQAQQLWLTGPVAPRHVGSSQTRARTRVPCISRQILNHCVTREAP